MIVWRLDLWLMPSIEFFLEKKYDAVYMVYTDFISSLKQEVRVRQLLPLQKSADLDLGAVSTEDRAEKFSLILENTCLSQLRKLF